MRITLTLTLSFLLVFGISSGCAGGDEMTEGDSYDTFDTWDANSNAEIDESEFDDAYYASGYYDDWDADNSGAIEEDEFSDLSSGEDFDDWDADDSGDLDEDETSAGLFDLWDESGDDVIDEDEYNTNFDSWFGDMNV